MDKDLFSGLDDLGFKDMQDVDLFQMAEEEVKAVQADIMNEEDRERSLLYSREIICPVCNRSINIKAIKKSTNKVVKRDSDFYIHYNIINPYFYEVWLCNHCGYAALSTDFLKIKSAQAELIKQHVSPKWKGKDYPDIFDVKIAIERYKLALLNDFYAQGVASKKAITCLKIAWMYRLMDDKANETTFMKQAIEGFEHAYTDEKFPFYDMDEFMVMYLIGELYRRIGDDAKALSWFGKVITSFGAKQKIKDKARDQRDLIVEERRLAEKMQAQIDAETAEAIDETTPVDDEAPKKGGFFSKFFK